jgi:hypothetical protein
MCDVMVQGLNHYVASLVKVPPDVDHTSEGY